MKKLATIFILFFACVINAQHTISGTFSPAKDYTWVIAYRLKPGTQVYVADTAIADGSFSLNIPEKALPGTYRLVYAVPQEEYYFDVIYNGKEDINLSFNQEQGVIFTASKENILFGTYFKEITDVERDIIAYYSSGSTDVKKYKYLLKKYHKVQNSYEIKTTGLIANEFIRANTPYIPSEFEPIQQYIQHKKKTYFQHLNLSNTSLQASGFLTDKITNYVLTALPLTQLTTKETEKEMQHNVDTVFEKLQNVSDIYTFHIGYTLWAQTSGSGFNETADYIYSNYLTKSPVASTNQEIMKNIAAYNRLRIGVIAPEITWQKKDSTQFLTKQTKANNYVLIFWSSTCGHCLKELPVLHKKLKEIPNIKVIAVGLEDDETSWKLESEKLTSFQHVISLGKWDSEYANTYDIHATPSYFILDKEKHIIAKPDNQKEVVTFLTNKEL